MNRAPFLLALCVLLSAAFQAPPALAQAKTYTGVCEDMFVPDYPKVGEPGTSLEEFRSIGLKLVEKAIVDCDSRAKGFFASDKIKLAQARVRALNGDKTALQKLREVANGGLAEASYLIHILYTRAKPVPPHKLETTDVTRAEAERELRSSAEKGYLYAIVRLAFGLSEGNVVRRDRKEAKVWFEKMLAITEKQPDQRADASLQLAANYFDDPEASAEEQQRIPALTATVSQSPALAPYAVWLEVRGRRLGIGWPKDAAAARRLAETSGAIDKAPPLKSEYLELLMASATPEDQLKLAVMLETAKPMASRFADQKIGEMLFSGVPAGLDRRRSFEFLTTLASVSHADAVNLAQRIVEHGKRVKVPPAMLLRLYEAADLKLPDADVALVQLMGSINSDAHEGSEALGLAQHIGAGSDGMALLLLERVANAGPYNIYKPFDTQAAAVAALDSLVEKGIPAALRTKGFALRRGKIYPQDDVEATKFLIKAAEAGDAQAMKLVAEAYSKGLGIGEDRFEHLRWLKAAAKAGLPDAQRSLNHLLTFRFAYPGLSVHDAVVGGVAELAEAESFLGITPSVVKSFGKQDIEKLGVDYLARSYMDGFRASMAARDDKAMVKIFKTVHEDIKLEIAQILVQEGFLKANPDGYMGPAIRQALATWARSKGLPEMEGDKPGPSTNADARLTGVPLLPPEVIAKMRNTAFTDFAAAKTEDAQKRPMQVLSVLAQYGDIETRLAVLKGFSEPNIAVQIVGSGLAVVYGIDVMLSKPKGSEKAESDFIFMVSNMSKRGQLPEAAQALLITLRDDPRLWAPENLDKVVDQFQFIPGYCDALKVQAQQLKVQGLDADACSHSSRRALVTWAKAAGPFGAEAQIRREAAQLLSKLSK